MSDRSDQLGSAALACCLVESDRAVEAHALFEASQIDPSGADLPAIHFRGAPDNTRRITEASELRHD